MNVLEIQTLACGSLEWFQQALIRLCLCVVVVLISVLILRTQPVRDAAARLASLWRDAAHFTRLVVLALVFGFVLYAGTKTNSPPFGIMMPILPPLPQSVLQTVTPEEIAQGWRLVAETNCAADVYAMPEGVSPSFNWHKRGTFGEWARLDLGGFAFPLGTNDETASSFSVFNDGRIRPTPRDTAREICAVGVPMLAMQGASRFWVADAARPETAPYLSKLLTWENFFLNADTNVPVNAQIELFGNGNFATRSNDVERIYSRVAYFDWDGDGLENSVDPNPLVAGPDAHGTNAEWYNVVCSNVFEAVEGGASGTPRPTLSWREGVNSNAYYFVEVVASNGLAPIYFTGDRESRLGNPVVVARASETNHVPLLIGVNYAVTSTVPFAVSFPDDGFAMVTTNGVSNYEVCWPLNFVFTESIEDVSRVYSVTIEPFDPGGELTWVGTGGGMRSGVSSECDCGCLHCGGNSVWFSCSSICTCDGECQSVGNYTVENALFAVTGGVCRCGFDDPGETGAATTNVQPLSVSFSSQAVIFEDVYEDSPGVTKPKRSTRVRITVDAYGGAYGGSLSVVSGNLGKLTPIGGGVELPIIGHALAADEHFHVTGVYEGAAASGSTNDVTLNGTFTEYFTSQQHPSGDSLTVVKVELRPKVVAPNNYSLNRHKYGVRELVQHIQEPLVPAVTWNPVGGGVIETVGLHDYYCCPLDGCENPLRAEIGTVYYIPKIKVIEPEGMRSKAMEPLVYSNTVHRGEAGGIGMRLRLFVLPLDVSFSEIAVEEVPCFTYEVEGYFENPYFNGAFAHTGGWWGAGAGNWSDVDNNNRFGVYDEAAYVDKIPWLTPEGIVTTNVAYAWTSGSAYIDNPFGWNVKGTTGNTLPHKRFGEYIRDAIMLDSHGRVGVFKLDNWVERSTNDVIHLYGPKATEEE